MKQEIACTTCGALLVRKVTERGVTPVDSDVEVPFRRTTDYVMCKSCMKIFPARELAEMAGVDEAAEPAEEHEADVIMLLERLAERRHRSG